MRPAIGNNNKTAMNTKYLLKIRYTVQRKKGRQYNHRYQDIAYLENIPRANRAW